VAGDSLGAALLQLAGHSIRRSDATFLHSLRQSARDGGDLVDAADGEYGLQEGQRAEERLAEV